MAAGSLSALWRSCHPGPVAAVTAVTALYARTHGRGLPGTVSAGGAVLAGQLAIGWQNDALDAPLDRAAARADKPAATGEVAPETLRRAARLAGLACVPLSLASGPRAGAIHLAAVASAASYNLALKTTPWSIAPYLVSFGLLPAFVDLGGRDGGRPTWWACGAGALLGAGAHVANTLPDLETDARNGVRGLPHRLGRGRSLVLAGASLLAATGLLALAGPGPAAGRVAAAAASGAIVASAALVARRDPTSRRPFDLVVVLAVLDVVLLLAATRAAS